ncbi:MAG: ferrochelatase [bacterium]
MHPREFLKYYKYDDRLVTGKYFPLQPLTVKKGETVGVVLMNLGGPNNLLEIEPFLYNLFMDPAIIDIPLRGILRHALSKWIARKRSIKVGEDYAKIGGGSPINKLTQEQAEKLELRLNQEYGESLEVQFKVYVAMRYWKPDSEETARQMQREGVDKVALLPLYPQYSKTTTGSSLIYWWMLEQKQEIPVWPTTCVPEYAAHPKYIQAISERMDEALQRFPREVVKKVHLLFSAHGTPVKEMKQRRDPYCCLIHATVSEVMKFRENDLPFHVAFQSKVGPAEWLTPSTPDKLQELAEQGHEAVLIVPVAFVTDHIETAFELNMLIRKQAASFGIEHYEVTGGLNSHPLFIEALAEAVASQIQFPEFELAGEHPIPNLTYSALPKFESTERDCRCHQCEHIQEAVCWNGQLGA